MAKEKRKAKKARYVIRIPDANECNTYAFFAKKSDFKGLKSRQVLKWNPKTWSYDRVDDPAYKQLKNSHRALGVTCEEPEFMFSAFANLPKHKLMPIQVRIGRKR